MIKRIKIFTLSLLLFQLGVEGQVFKKEISFNKTILNARLVSSSKTMDFYESVSNDNKIKKSDLPAFALTYYTSMNYQTAQKYLEHQKSYVLKENKIITNQKVIDTVINDFKFYILTMTAEEKNSKKIEQLVYGFVIKDNNTAIFLGSTTGDKKFIKKLEETVLSIKI